MDTDEAHSQPQGNVSDETLFDVTHDGPVGRDRSHSTEEAAAMRIQKVLRGMQGRHTAHELRLWDTWHKLDTLEEKDLTSTHVLYEKLKELYARQKVQPRLMFISCSNTPNTVRLCFLMLDHS